MPPKTKIFVGKLPNECSEGALLKLFERHGEVTECSVLGNFGFVHMKTEDEAMEAIRALNNYHFQGSNISVEQSTGEKRDSGGSGYRGRGGRGGGGPMRGRGGGGGMYGGPYDRPRMADRYGGPPPITDRYGGHLPPPPPIPRASYYDEYDRRDHLRRAPLPPPGHLHMERRPLPPPPYARDPYDRYDAYERLAPLPRRSPPHMMEGRIPPPLGYDRRPDPYADLYRERDPYSVRDIYGGQRSMSPRRYAGAPRDMPPPPRRF